jgi:hypothetical protein
VVLLDVVTPSKNFKDIRMDSEPLPGAWFVIWKTKLLEDVAVCMYSTVHTRECTWI